MPGKRGRVLQAPIAVAVMIGIAIAAAPVRSFSAESSGPGASPAAEEKPRPKRRAARRASRPAPEVAAPAPAPPVINPKYNDIMTAVMARDQAGAAEALRAGMWVDRPDSNGMTPLMLAAMQGDPGMTALLLEHGANPNRTGPQGNLHAYAGIGGNAKVVELLTKAGAR